MNRYMRTLLILVLLALPALTAIPLTGGEKILFIGNSLTGWSGGLDNRVREACAAGGVTITTGSYGEAATELIDIFNHGTAVSEIRKGWDIVVLQGWLHAENANVGDREKLIEAVVKFNNVITSTGAQTVLYQTFPGQNQGTLYSTIAMVIAESYDLAAARIGNAPVAPCGLAWRTIWIRPPVGQSQNMLYSDFIHPNEVAHVLNSYVFYMTLTGKSPIGLINSHPTITVDPAVDSTLQFRAWQMVANRNNTTALRQDRLTHPLTVTPGVAQPIGANNSGTFMVNGRSFTPTSANGRGQFGAGNAHVVLKSSPNKLIFWR